MHLSGKKRKWNYISKNLQLGILNIAYFHCKSWFWLIKLFLSLRETLFYLIISSCFIIDIPRNLFLVRKLLKGSENPNSACERLLKYHYHYKLLVWIIIEYPNICHWILNISRISIKQDMYRKYSKKLRRENKGLNFP